MRKWRVSFRWSSLRSRRWRRRSTRSVNPGMVTFHRMSCICTLPIFLTPYLADDGCGGALWRLFDTPFSQVSMWVQLQIPKIEDGNNFGVAVQVSTSRASLVPGCVWCKIWIFFLFPSGESVWTPDQHTHQDRSLPNPDLKVRVCSPVWQLFFLMVLHNYGNTDNFFAFFFFFSSLLHQILQWEGRRSGQSFQTATRGQFLWETEFFRSFFILLDLTRVFCDRETTDSWSMSWTSISTLSSASWSWTSAAHM